MDTVIQMAETEQQLIQILALMRESDDGFTGKEFEKRFRISQWKRKKIFDFAIQNGLLVSYLGKRLYCNGIENVKTLYRWTDKAHAYFTESSR